MKWDNGVEDSGLDRSMMCMCMEFGFILIMVGVSMSEGMYAGWVQLSVGSGGLLIAGVTMSEGM